MVDSECQTLDIEFEVKTVKPPSNAQLATEFLQVWVVVVDASMRRYTYVGFP
jgi:hypothetical protein